MRKALLVLSATLAFGASLAIAQVAPGEHRAEQATEAQNGIYDTVDVVNGPAVDQISNHAATLRWQTNKVAATRVNYGTDPNNLFQTAYIPGGTTNHEVVLRELRPHTTYYFAIENTHGRGRLTGTFQTQ
jgi:hypothetical protein